MAEDKFWIDVVLDSRESEEKVLKALTTLNVIHISTIDYLNAYFKKEGVISSYQEYREELNKLIREERLWKHTQRYSLERVAEHSFPYFSLQPKFDEKSHYLIPVKPKNIDEIQIRARNVWPKYLATGRGLTTTYGVIFLEGKWKEILREQAGEIALDLFPFLWHSITLKIFTEDNWKIKFNFHSPNSRQGQRAKEELEREYGDI